MATVKLEITEKHARIFWGGATEATITEMTDKNYAEKRYKIEGGVKYDDDSIILDGDLQHAIERGGVKVVG